MKKLVVLLVLAAFVAGGVFAQNRSEPNPDSDFTFDAKTGTIKKYVGTDKRCVVPEAIGGVPVAAIGGGYPGAFTGNKIVTQVVLPPSVVSIGDRAFMNSSLEYITVQGKLKSIGANAFEGTNLKNFISAWPDGSNGILKIPNGLYRNSALTGALEIPANITEIGDYAFAGTQIQSVTLHRNVKRIGAGAFQNCKQLTTVTVSSSISSLIFGSGSFTGTALNAASKKALLDRGAPAGESAFK
ncbi:MAG: leucine-rich repeat domain-containing protein [Treponema sp.]|nr:leucine-rich repeat domain-containing protein [Treponema sp.]